MTNQQANTQAANDDDAIDSKEAPTQAYVDLLIEAMPDPFNAKCMMIALVYLTQKIATTNRHERFLIDVLHATCLTLYDKGSDAPGFGTNAAAQDLFSNATKHKSREALELALNRAVTKLATLWEAVDTAIGLKSPPNITNTIKRCRDLKNNQSGQKSAFQRTADWLAACGKKPSPGNASLQIGCHLEETKEFITTLEFGAKEDQVRQHSLVVALEELSIRLKKGKASVTVYDREEALDALSGACVAADGVAYMLEMDKPSADAAVLDSNDDKMLPGGIPVILEGGKIGKRPGWVKPDLSAFV